LVGLGGGIVAVPLMSIFLKLSQHHAVATSLVMVVFTGLAGALTYATQGTVDWLAALVIFPSAMLTANWGARFANRLPEWKLKRIFGWYLVVVALSLLLKPYIPHVDEPLQGWLKIIPLIVTGAAAGFASGLLGVGGGTITVPIMVLLVGLEQHTAQGTSLLAIVGILIGAFAGGLVANQLPEFWLRLVFSGVLIWTALRYVGARPKTSPQAT